ncbi:unnamed protein product [Ilex paraguariensis]|uniref:HTH La-type RNA-binding domain-containing protein n=1 Tax=Ilex paraguariensis TaxID=185542 RepID=A0ABC8T8S1_9AQUA
MAMAENEATGDDQKDVSGPPKSPWKTATAADASRLMAADTDSWPALSDAQRPKNSDAATTTTTKSLSPPPPPVQTASGPAELQKPHGRGNPNPSHKHSTLRQQKAGSKRTPNGVPPFPVPLPYYQPTIPPVFHAMPPVPHIPVPGYAYRPSSGPFPSAETHLVKPGSETPMQNFVPPVNFSVQPPPRGDANAYFVNFSNGRPNVQEPGSYLNPPWHHQRAFASKGNIHPQQNMGARAFVRPPYLGPAPGFIGGPPVPGPPGAIYYLPAAPPGSIRVPHPPFFVPQPLYSGNPVPPSETLALRASIVKQIEYYFSDENLRSDHYLISLMNDQGWVPISVIADFKRVKRMSSDIPFILDALQSSNTIEVQGDKVRRRDEWSNWAPASAEHKSSSETLIPQGQPADKLISALKSIELSEGVTRCTSEGTDGCPSKNESSVEHSLPETEYRKVLVNSNAEYNRDKILFDGGTQAFIGGNGDLSIGLNSVSNIQPADLDTIDGSPEQNLDDQSLDFASTFMFDEELELEQKTVKKDHLSSVRRIDDEENEMIVNDQAVERLVIVTQNSRIGEGTGTDVKESKSISHELASALNDGLYFYEQELKAKRSNRRRNNSSYGSRDGESRSSGIASAVSNARTSDHSMGGSGCEGPGNSNSRKKQNKGFSKQQSVQKQRLFFSNFKIHGTGRNFHDMISESPPSNSVGFFFGSTPPDNHGQRSSKLSASPHGNLSGSSPPVGSMPKPFPPFQHPSHQLLEENGFRQQKYLKYQKRCLSERKKLGIGCSEVFLSLFQFSENLYSCRKALCLSFIVFIVFASGEIYFCMG